MFRTSRGWGGGAPCTASPRHELEISPRQRLNDWHPLTRTRGSRKEPSSRNQAKQARARAASAPERKLTPFAGVLHQLSEVLRRNPDPVLGVELAEVIPVEVTHVELGAVRDERGDLRPNHDVHVIRVLEVQREQRAVEGHRSELGVTTDDDGCVQVQAVAT